MQPHCNWSPLADTWQLPRDALHVLRASTQQFAGPDQQAALRALLIGEERERADRFVFDRDRLAFQVGRGLVRILLGRQQGCHPREVRIEYNEFGKPVLPTDAAHFNVSHSGEVVLIGLCRDRPAGVDVERLRPLEDAQRLSQEFFSGHESTELAKVPAAERLRAFFQIWTRKEAFIKAKGLGLSLPLDQFDVPIYLQAPLQWESIAVKATEAQDWRVADLEVGQDYVAAVVVPGSELPVKMWECGPQMLLLREG